MRRKSVHQCTDRYYMCVDGQNHVRCLLANYFVIARAGYIFDSRSLASDTLER